MTTSNGLLAASPGAGYSREVSRASTPALDGQRTIATSNVPSKVADAVELSVPPTIGNVVDVAAFVLPIVPRLIGAALVSFVLGWQTPAIASTNAPPMTIIQFSSSGSSAKTDRVSDVLDQAVLTSPISGKERDTARSAYQEARSVLGKIPFTLLPKSSVTEDGCISLLWSGSQRSVIVVFGGDNNVVYSIKRGDGKFGDDIRQFSVADRIPNELKQEVARFI